MKAPKLFSAAIVVCLFSFVSFAQEDSIPAQLKQTIQTAFDNYKLKDSISIDSELGEELVEGYYQGFIDLDPKIFHDEKLKDLFKYYATQEGIEGLFRDWMVQSDILDSVFTIGEFLRANILIDFEKPGQENTQKPEPPKGTTSSSQSTSVETTGRDRMVRERVSDRQFAHSQRLGMDQRVMSRNRTAEVKPQGSQMASETQVRVKHNMDEVAFKKIPDKMLIARTMEFEEKRKLAISQLQDSIRLSPVDSQSIKTYKMLSINTPNKYATLIINEPDKPTANIFLNGKLMGELVKIKNGIKVRSKRQYNYEIKLVDAVYCSDTITLAPKEKRITKCKAH